jgi:ubiquinone/menaquinone biosynthesis C-methylase UbiE
MHTGTLPQADTHPAHAHAATTTRNLFAATAPLTDDAFTERSRKIWSAGDYDRIAAGFRHEAESFVARLGLTPALQVLDVASGSGNLTIPAARTGAAVIGFDLVPSLLAQASQWAEQEGLVIALDQGNAEELPYDDAQFDVVMSMFGVMFAARPDKVVSELTRVTRKGGRVALANWTRTSFVGQMFALHGKFAPPPTDIPSPLLWGDRAVLYDRFNARDWELQLTPRVLEFRYPCSPAESAALFVETYGPTVMTIARLDHAQRVEFTRQLIAHWKSQQKGAGRTTVVDSEYLEVIATRR